MKTNHIPFLLLLCFINSSGLAQAKKIKFKNEYEHFATKTVFPKLLFDYELDEVNAFDKKKENVCVEYKSLNPQDTSKISIYIYPAGSADEGRLRNEYLNCLTAINYYATNRKQFQFILERIEDENYIVNGLKTSFTDDQKNNSELSIYECGRWFFKVRITSNKLSNAEIDNLEKEVVKKYSPPKFTALKPLNLKPSCTVSRGAFRDSLFLASSLACSFKKSEWSIKNVAEKEKRSGFPDLYLKMHIESIKKFIELGEIGKNIKMKRTEFTGKFINQIKALISSGFLEEYIMEAYQKIMIVPDDIVLDYTEYGKWKQNNEVPEFLFPASVLTAYKDE